MIRRMFVLFTLLFMSFPVRAMEFFIFKSLQELSNDLSLVFSTSEEKEYYKDGFRRLLFAQSYIKVASYRIKDNNNYDAFINTCVALWYMNSIREYIEDDYLKKQRILHASITLESIKEEIEDIICNK